LLARAVKNAGISVLLTGEGADEVLAGYPHLRRDLLLERGASTAELDAHNGASAGLMMPDAAGLDTTALSRALGFVPSFIEAKAALGARASALLSRDVTEAFAGRDPYGEIADALDITQLAGRERIDQSTYVWCKLALAGYILRTLGDGTEMAHAVEGRVPFLDHGFFDLARAMRTHDKIRGEVEKYMLREALKADLPEEVIARRKHPLVAPPVFAGGVCEPLRDVLASRAVPSFFDTRAVAGVLDRLEKASALEQKLWDPPLMLVLTATLIARRYVPHEAA
jgi:asparagine synthase (glutamine-hydrolysing)